MCCVQKCVEKLRQFFRRGRSFEDTRLHCEYGFWGRFVHIMYVRIFISTTTLQRKLSRDANFRGCSPEKPEVKFPLNELLRFCRSNRNIQHEMRKADFV